MFDDEDHPQPSESPSESVVVDAQVVEPVVVLLDAGTGIVAELAAVGAVPAVLAGVGTIVALDVVPAVLVVVVEAVVVGLEW